MQLHIPMLFHTLPGPKAGDEARRANPLPRLNLWLLIYRLSVPYLGMYHDEQAIQSGLHERVLVASVHGAFNLGSVHPRTAHIVDFTRTGSVKTHCRESVRHGTAHEKQFPLQRSTMHGCAARVPIVLGGLALCESGLNGVRSPCRRT